MATPKLTPEEIARLESVQQPLSYNWAARRLARFRQQLNVSRQRYESVLYMIEHGDYNITLANPATGEAVTINAQAIEGDVAGELTTHFVKEQKFLVACILEELKQMETPGSEHQQDMTEEVAERLEVLRVILAPEDFAAVTAPVPMVGPDAPVLSMAALASVEGKRAA